MAWTSDRPGRMFIGGFVGFFLAPPAVVVLLTFLTPEGVNYENCGLVLLLSVLGGGVFGAIVGLLVLSGRPADEFGTEGTWTETLWDPELDI